MHYIDKYQFDTIMFFSHNHDKRVLCDKNHQSGQNDWRESFLFVSNTYLSTQYGCEYEINIKFELTLGEINIKLGNLL